MIQEKNLKAPREVLDGQEKMAERVKSFIASRKIRLSDEKTDSIERDIDKKYSAWKRNTSPLKRRLTKLNDMLEGIVEETNSPFEGAANLTVHYSLGVVRTFQSTYNKTSYQDYEIFTPSVDPEAKLSEDEIKSLEGNMNYSFSIRYNGLDTLKEGTIPCTRDGTLIVAGGWERRIETAHDVKVYSDFKDFKTDYPDAESSGLSEEEYESLGNQFIIDPEFELHALYAYDFVAFDGIEYEIVPLPKFVFWPSFAKEIKRMELYGKEYQSSEAELKIKEKNNEFYSRGVHKVLNAAAAGQYDAWDRGRDYAEGIRPSQDEYKPVALADLVYKKDLNGDGIPEKYLVTYAPEQKALLFMQPYPLRRNIDFCVAFRMSAREGRFLGHSLVGDCEDMFNLVDTIHRHRNNIRMLVASPILLVNEKYKDMIDLGRAENVIRPGLSFWVSDIDTSVKQLALQNLDQPGNSLDEENLAKQYVELVFGPTQGLSGRQTPDDPRAPARKTQLLLMQANQRIDDYMDEFRKSLGDLAELHGALLYHYASGDQISYEQSGKSISTDKSLFANDMIKWMAKRRSVTLTPEFAMARTAGLIQTYASLFPLLQSGDPIAMEMWNRQVRNSGEPDPEDLEKKAQLSMQGNNMPAPPGQAAAGAAGPNKLILAHHQKGKHLTVSPGSSGNNQGALLGA